MKPPSADSKRWLALSVLALVLAGGLVAAVVLFQQRARRGEGGQGSSFRGDAQGARALYLLLRRELGRVSPRTSPVARRMDPGLLVVINPAGTLDEKQAKIIADWVEDGGALLAACPAENALAKAFGVEVTAAQAAGMGLAQPVTTDLAAEAHAIATYGDASLGGLAVEYCRRGTAVQAGEVGRGAGRAVFVADLYSSSNAGLDAADNVFFYLWAARRLAAGRPVSFLETHHGFLREPSVAEYAVEIGLGGALVQLVLVALLGCWVAGARSAPPLAPSTLERRAAAEYAETLAHLYRRGRARAHAVKVALHEFQRWRAGPGFSKALRRADNPVRAAKDADDLIAQGQKLAAARAPAEDAAYRWITRAAALRKKVGGADHE